MVSLEIFNSISLEKQFLLKNTINQFCNLRIANLEDLLIYINRNFNKPFLQDIINLYFPELTKDKLKEKIEGVKDDALDFKYCSWSKEQISIYQKACDDILKLFK